MAFPRALRGIGLWAVAVAAIAPIGARLVVDPMQHDLQVVNAKTFTTNVQLARQTTVVGAFFYSTPDSNLAHTVDEMNALAKDLKGVVNVVAVNCSDHALKSLCKQELGDDYGTPVFKVYPRLPAPPRTFEVGAANSQLKLAKDELKRELLKHLPSNVYKIEEGMLTTFMASHELLPKVLLFSDKEHPSYVYKALSNAFHVGLGHAQKKLVLGFVDVNKHADMKREFKVTQVPTMLVLRPNGKPQRYKGEFKYRPMFEWLNVSSEAFLLGGGYSDKASPAATKPWKFEKVPKLHFYSHMDVCFNKKQVGAAHAQGLCVIYLTKGELKPDEMAMLVDLSEKYEGQLTSKWMWMDLAEEEEFAKLFGLSALPSAVVFNPKKRLRYFLHDGSAPATRLSLERMLEKILGGDAKFTHLAEGLPRFKMDEGPGEEL